MGLDMNQCSAAIQGFGNVGSIAAYSLARYGAKVIAVSDVQGGLYHAKGLDLVALEKYVALNGTLAGFPGSGDDH